MPARPPATALHAALGSVGDRWSLLVVAALLDGPRRFNELLGDVGGDAGGIAPNVLSARLRHLEEHGVVISAPYSRRPLRLTYQLSAAGLALADALRVLTGWGAARRDGSAAMPPHSACGTALETRWYCPTCARTVDDEEGDGLVHL